MRDYGKVSPQFWIGETGRKLRGCLEAQIVAAYLVTGPSAHPLGIYYLPLPTISHDTGLSIAGATKGLRRVIEGGFAYYDEPSSYVYVPEMARFQVAETIKPGDKRHGWVIGELIRVKITRFVAHFVEKYRTDWQLDQGKKWADLTRLIEGASEGHRSQEQEQEQEQETDSAEADASARTLVPIDQLLAAETAEEITARTRKEQRACRLPKDFPLTDALKKIASDNGCRDPDLMHAAFCDYWRSRGRAMADWVATWRVWARDGHCGNPVKACACLKTTTRGAHGQPLTGSMAAIRRVGERILSGGVT